MLRALALLSIFFGIWAGPASANTGEIVQAILGKTLESKHVKQAHIYADGTLDGVFNGISYAGNWTMEDGRYCRELTRGLISAHACLDLKPIVNADGKMIAVLFEAPGVSTRFEIRSAD